jgi:hypothetical protein
MSCKGIPDQQLLRSLLLAVFDLAKIDHGQWCRLLSRQRQRQRRRDYGLVSVRKRHSFSRICYADRKRLGAHVVVALRFDFE